MLLKKSAVAAGALLALAPRAWAGDVLKNDGFKMCSANSEVTVERFNLQYNRDTQTLSFDIAGTNQKSQKVEASLFFEAYGNEVYRKDFNPCDEATKVEQLCPIPQGHFQAKGEQKIPDEYAEMIPSVAFAVPDLQGNARLVLKSVDSGDEVACLLSGVTNGRTTKVAAVSYVAVGIAGAALAASGLSALTAAAYPGAHASGPGFADVIGWFQSMATNGMLSVQYPDVYRNFASNFGFSAGLIPWRSMQLSIDRFRNDTGGNLTADSYEFLLKAHLVHDNGKVNASALAKRALGHVFQRSLLYARDNDNTEEDGVMHVVKGVQGYVEELSIPKSNTFMTVLLFFAVVVAAIAVGILLLKVILEVWALFGSFPSSLKNFRKHYWGMMARTIVNLILVVYGIWVLYCIYQFIRGDSWAAKLLAAVTLVAFTGVLLFFTIRIVLLARRYRGRNGDPAVLYEDDKIWRRYSMFYDAYKRDYWWIFIPAIVYMFAKGCIIAGGDGHGMVQTVGQLIVEALMLILLLWHRPYVAKSSQWINISIQVVRVLSVTCILVFVEELGMSQTTQTVTGIVLIAVQSTLTGVLAILIAVNALIMCLRKNPHAKLREKRKSYDDDDDGDNLTAMDARNSLLLDGAPRKAPDSDMMGKYNMTGPYEPYRDHVPTNAARHSRYASTTRLIQTPSRSPSPEEHPQRGYGVAY